MISKEVKLSENVLDLAKVEQKPTRAGYGEGLVLAGDENPNVVALCADLTESTQMHLFRNKYPKRFVEIGIGEQNLAAVASGMAAMGKVPFISSYAMFSPGNFSRCGCPCNRDPNFLNVFNSSTGKYPECAIAEYNTGQI